jgi:hypothetical protein
LIDHPDPPWLSVHLPSRYEPVSLFGKNDFIPGPSLSETKDPIAYLGAAAAILVVAEMTCNRALPEEGDPPFGSFGGLYPYILMRWGHEQDAKLPELPVSVQFQRLFRTWATQHTDFIRYSADL